MARVAVVGGGYGGMAAAARLAKLGHDVTLLERGPRLGGALAPVERDGFTWDGGPTSTMLPAVVRDLFRKTGRPADRELELVELDVLREHRFADGTSVRLPFGSRAAQIAAVDALGTGLGRQWADHVQGYADDWEALRRDYLERPWDPADLPAPLAQRLRGRESLARRVRRLDERLGLIALHPVVAEGHEPRDVPAWVGVTAYVEQRFGAWTVAGGMGVLADALTARLATRGVVVRTGVEVRDLVLRDGKAVAVDTADGPVDVDLVVVACDPRRLPALAGLVRATMPAMPPVVCHLGLGGHLPDMSHETVLHGSGKEPTLVVRTGGQAPDGAAAWTVLGRGRVDEDLAAGADPARPGPARPRRGPRRPLPAGPGPGLGRLTARRALAGVAHRVPPARPVDAGPRCLRLRRPCDTGGRPPVRRAVGRSGRPGDRARVTLRPGRR